MDAIVEIRKVVEHDGDHDQYWTLTFFCDWALHPKLTKKKAERILIRLDKRLSRYNPARPHEIDSDGEVGKFLSFELFREHLLAFFKRNGLPTAWAEDPFFWADFCVIYGEIIRHTPLVVTRDSGGLTYLQKLVISACEPSALFSKHKAGDKLYGFRWEFTLDDGRSFSMHHTTSVGEPPANWKTLGLNCK